MSSILILYSIYSSRISQCFPIRRKNEFIEMYSRIFKCIQAEIGDIPEILFVSAEHRPGTDLA